MSIDHTRTIIAAAQCMSDGDAIDFIDKHVTIEDIAAWVENMEPERKTPLFSLYGVTLEDD